jgi:hypothetical protein
MATGALAFANARIRARKSQLLDGAAKRGGGADVRSTLDAVSCYRLLFQSLPRARRIVRALLERREIENVKLLWRVLARGRSTEHWLSLWHPLEPLATVSLDAARDCASLTQFVEHLQATPYGDIAAAMWRGHHHDVLAAELGFDRWISRRLLDAADALATGEEIARDLIRSVAGERDLQLLRRGAATYALAPDAVAGALAFVPRTMSQERIATLARWRPQDGGFAALWPRAWRHVVAAAADWDALLTQWRHAQYRLCSRAFLGNPFSLAPAVALLLLVDEEARAVAALAQMRGDTDARSLEFALAASAIGH